MDTPERVQLRDLPDYLISRGRYSISVDEVQALTALSYQSAVSGMQRLRRQGRVFAPGRGLYVLVPAEYRSWGVVPAEWFIDDLMRHLGRRYYVALLCAAEIHRAGHQAPQVFQVMTDARVQNRDLARVRLRFYTTEALADIPTVAHNTHTGTVPVSTKEATVVDLVTHLRASGGINNVATVLREIGELDGSPLGALVDRHGRAAARRLGWLVDHYGDAADLSPVRLAARLNHGEPSLLAPSGPRRGRTDPAWRLRLNTSVEPDL